MSMYLAEAAADGFYGYHGHVYLPPAAAIPDFTAGLVYGLTGDNNLNEIRHCMDVSQPIIDEGVAALTDFKNLHPISGLKHVGNIFWDLPDAFSTCTGMHDDITAIDEWAQIFHHPVHLAETVSKRWLVHGTEIKQAIAENRADWHDHKWFDAGEKAADALVLLLGPINQHQTLEDFAHRLAIEMLY